MSTPEEERASEGAPDWMVSYADMITILMSFFAVMFSLAMSKNANKDAPLLKSLQRQFGYLGGQSTTIYIPFGAALRATTVAQTSPRVDSRARRLGGDFTPVDTIPADDQATIGGVIYFDSGASALNEEQRQQLRAVAKALEDQPQKIEILGHTLGQSRDTDDKLHDNWNLAQARCDNTMRYLVALGIDPRRIRIGVSAQFEPISSGRDALRLPGGSSVEVFMPLAPEEPGLAETNARARD